MPAPTAVGLLKAIDRRRTVAALNALVDMDEAHHAALRRSLEAVPPNSRIDVRVLLDCVRKEVAKRIAAEAAERRSRADPARYEALLRAQGWTRPPRSPSLATAAAPETGDKPGDHEPRRRRGVRRIRPHTGEDAGTAPSKGSAPAAPETRPERSLRRPGRYFGPKVFAAGDEIAAGPAEGYPPPWVLPSDDGRDAAQSGDHASCP